MKKEPLMIIIFGATGDLNKRKLIPALFKLYQDDYIDESNPIICISRSEMSTTDFVKKIDLNKFVPNASGEELNKFIKLVQYQALDFSDNCYVEKCENCSQCKKLAKTISDLNKINECNGNIVYYLATPPSTFENIARIIEKSIPQNCKEKLKIAFEKPFGFDLSSSRKLNHSISSLFSEKQTYRVDHYLGKALVQDLLLFRFSNLLYEQVWNNKFVDNIQITISESIGVEFRAGYYDKTGAIKDMLQNHIMQLISLATMEEPESFSANHIRTQMAKVLEDLKLPDESDLVIGQYRRNPNIENSGVSYLEEPGIDKKSKTETYAALKMEIDNERWNGVPIYVRTGKQLESTYSQIKIVLKDVTCKLFLKGTCDHESPNKITIRIWPDTGIDLSFNIKKPGPGLEVMPVKMDLCHRSLFGINTPEAYEAIFQAIISGDQTIFTSWDSIERSWKYIDHILGFVQSEEKLSYYEPGSTGPVEADALLEKRGHSWINRTTE